MTANAIDNAISRLQTLALRCTSVSIKSAPDYPVEDAGMLPLSIAYISSGELSVGEASTAAFIPVVLNVDFHFNRVSMKQAYQQIDQIAYEYGRRLAGDPTLNGKVDTIIYPVTYRAFPSTWDKVTTQLLQFSIPVKILDTPQATT
jgi:hypothetical protein